MCNGKLHFLCSDHYSHILRVKFVTESSSWYVVLTFWDINMLISERKLYAMLRSVWYHLYNLKNVKNVQGEAYNFTKCNTPPWMFSKFFKLYKWYQIAQRITYKGSLNWETSFIMCGSGLFFTLKKNQVLRIADFYDVP